MDVTGVRENGGCHSTGAEGAMLFPMAGVHVASFELNGVLAWDIEQLVWCTASFDGLIRYRHVPQQASHATTSFIATGSHPPTLVPLTPVWFSWLCFLIRNTWLRSRNAKTDKLRWGGGS